MKLIVDGLELDYDMSKLLNTEVIAITKVTGVKFDEFAAELSSMNMELITAMVWVLRKRTEPDLRYSDVTFPIGSIEAVAESQGTDAPAPKGDSMSESETTTSTSPPSLSSSDSTPGISTG